MKVKIFVFAALLSTTPFSACQDNSGQPSTHFEPQIVDNTDKETSIPTEKVTPKPRAINNPFVGKYFYICTWVDTDFDDFYNKEDFFFVFYFKDRQTVIYYANINGWQPGIVGRYKYENNQIVMSVPQFFSGQPRGENFGGDVKILNNKQIEILVSGSPRYRLLNFTPQ